MRVVYLCLSWSNVKTALSPAPQLKTLGVTWGNNQVSSWEDLEIHLDFIQVVNWLKRKILEVTWVRSGSEAGEDIGCGQPQQQQYKLLLNTHLLSILWDKQELGLAARHRHGHVAVAETLVRVCMLSQPQTRPAPVPHNTLLVRSHLKEKETGNAGIFRATVGPWRPSWEMELETLVGLIL